jgi:protein O-mannosyl-transferase
VLLSKTINYNIYLRFSVVKNSIVLANFGGNMFNSVYKIFQLIVLLLSITFISSIAFAQNSENSKPDGNTANLVAVAIRFYELKQYDRAIEVATNAANLLPKDYRPWAIIGNCYLSQWKMKSASEAYAKAAEINPKHRGLWYSKAVADRMRNAREESIEAAKKAIEIDPNYAEAYEIMGESLAMGSKDNKGAIEAFRMALKLKPNFPKASENLGMQLSVYGDIKEAEEVYRKAMELDPQKMVCRFPLGRILVKMGRLTEARQIWNDRKYDEKDTFPLFITLLERAEKKKSASDKLAAEPNNPEALLEMGLIEMDGEFWSVDGRQKSAIVYFEKALKIKPDFAKAQYGICKAYVEIAYHEKNENATLDRELEKLKKMDAKLAKEIEEYRKSFVGALKGFSSKPLDQ